MPVAASFERDPWSGNCFKIWKDTVNCMCVEHRRCHLHVCCARTGAEGDSEGGEGERGGGRGEEEDEEKGRRGGTSPCIQNNKTLVME
jgi:hypothetical protein